MERLRAINIAYTSDVCDGKVVIENSQGDSVVSDNPVELLTFMGHNYTEALNKKVCWNLDTFIAPILKLLGEDICKELVTEPDCESHFDGLQMYYHRKTSLGLTIPNERKSYFYHLSQFYEEDTEISDAHLVRDKMDEFTKACWQLGINPLKMSSVASLFESNILDRLELPSFADINLPPEQVEELGEWIESMMWQEWTTNMAIGYWGQGESFAYDQSSAYGAALANTYNPKYATFIKSTTPNKDAHWGILKGEITINPDTKCSPILYRNETTTLNPHGTWEGVFSLPEIRWIYKRGIGTFKLHEGYFWKYTAPQKPFEVPMRRVFDARQQGGLVKKIAKRIGASTWGKLRNQYNKSGEVNKYYSPITAIQVITMPRLKVADFIYDNGLQDEVVHIGTDSVRTTKYVDMPDTAPMGKWRYIGDEACMILEPSRIWTPTHKPDGNYLEDWLKQISDDGKAITYERHKQRRRTLAEALEAKDLNLVGELFEPKMSIDLLGIRGHQDMQFVSFPNCGGDVLKNKYYGKPILVKG